MVDNFETFVEALNYATEKHEGQKRLDGKPYIMHPISVGLAVEGHQQKMVAILHDILEDTDTTYEELEDMFGEEIANDVFLLSKPEDMNYEEYIGNIKRSNNPIVTTVKIADLKDNLSTINNIQDEDKRNRLRDRYTKALEVLTKE